MIILLQIILLTSIWCIGIKIVTQDGMLLAVVRKEAEKRFELGSVIYDPLVLCEWCMPSIHSVFGYGFAVAIGVVDHFSWRLILMYPLVVMGASLLCGMIWATYKMIEIKTKHFEHIEQLSYFDLKERKFNHQKTNGVKR